MRAGWGTEGLWETAASLTEKCGKTSSSKSKTMCTTQCNASIDLYITSMKTSILGTTVVEDIELTGPGTIPGPQVPVVPVGLVRYQAHRYQGYLRDSP